MGGTLITQTSENAIFDHLKWMLEDERESARTRAAKARQGLRLIPKSNDPSDLVYKVVLTSLWADHDEKSVTVERQGPIPELMQEAITEFLRINNRSDVQAQYGVYVVLAVKGKPLYNIPLPENFWKEYKWVAPDR